MGPTVGVTDDEGWLVIVRVEDAESDPVFDELRAEEMLAVGLGVGVTDLVGVLVSEADCVGEGVGGGVIVAVTVKVGDEVLSSVGVRDSEVVGVVVMLRVREPVEVGAGLSVGVSELLCPGVAVVVLLRAKTDLLIVTLDEFVREIWFDNDKVDDSVTLAVNV